MRACPAYCCCAAVCVPTLLARAHRAPPVPNTLSLVDLSLHSLWLIFLCMQAAAREGAGAAAGGGRELSASRAAARRQPAHPQLQTWRHRRLGQTLYLSAVRCASREAAAPNRRQDTHRPMCVRVVTQCMSQIPAVSSCNSTATCSCKQEIFRLPPAVLLDLACCLVS